MPKIQHPKTAKNSETVDGNQNLKKLKKLPNSTPENCQNSAIVDGNQNSSSKTCQNSTPKTAKLGMKQT
jgi:hypothetical protein